MLILQQFDCSELVQDLLYSNSFLQTSNVSPIGSLHIVYFQ